MAWYQSLPPQSIHSWRDLTEQFSRHFTASRKHPKTVHALEAIYQAEDETLRNFVERFNKEAVQVETTDDMKKYLLQRGLRPGSDFAKAVGIEKPPTWDDLLLKAQKYIDYEEVQAADVARLARPGSSHPAREPSHRHDDRGSDRGHDRGGDRGGERGRDRRRGDRRESRGPPSTFATYTPLVKSRGEIFAEVHISEFNRANVKQPKPTPLKPGQDKNRYCRYHKSYGHRTDDCIQLKDAIEILIRNGQLREFVKRNNDPRPEAAETRAVEEVVPPPAGPSGTKQIAMSVSRPEDFNIPSYMANMDVRRVLIDPGSSCDIMYASLFRTLQLDETHLTPYMGSDLTGFNGATTRPWGYVDLIVTFGSEETAKSIRVKFLVVDCPCLYQCIIGRTAIADLMAVPSTAHLKMKYYTHKGQVATLHGDIEAARRCFDAASKGNNFIGKAPEAKKPKPSSETPPKPSPEAPPSLPGPSQEDYVTTS
ncbi:uncharacterized protein LOC123886013 [Trifolium pratense]|uniref:uncharacterized protein LOC123886013 n=1 Tax=Trifolium pratense TaxID=57577 RepID=UPI001E692C8C|nr:uncharacterized protein LOC123886013 [Trifolium pratense]